MKKRKLKKDRIAKGIAFWAFAVLGGFIIQVPAVASDWGRSVKSSESEGNVISLKAEAERDNSHSLKEDKKKGEVENYPDAYLSVDKPAQYAGGESQLLQDLSETIVYPEEAMAKSIQGRVVVRFQINTNGTLSNCAVAYSQSPILNEAAIKAVENLPGKWIPAEVDDKPVASIFNMPVTFKLHGK